MTEGDVVGPQRPQRRNHVRRCEPGMAIRVYGVEIHGEDETLGSSRDYRTACSSYLGHRRVANPNDGDVRDPVEIDQTVDEVLGEPARD